MSPRKNTTQAKREVAPRESPSTKRVKRKAKSPSPESDVHMLRGPIKKMKLSSAFKTLPAVTVTAKIEETILKNMAKSSLVFGSDEEDATSQAEAEASPSAPEVAAPSNLRSPSRRSRTKTEKARLAEEVTPKAKASKKKPQKKQTRKKTPCEEEAEEAEVGDGASEAASGDSVSSPPPLFYPASDDESTATDDPFTETKQDAESDAGSDAGSEDGQAVVTPTKKTKSRKVVPVSPDATPTNKRSRKKVKAAETESPVVAKTVKKPKQYAQDSVAADPSPKSDRNTKNEGGEPVMLVECQDPELRLLYEGLPKLKKLCDVQPLSMSGGGESARVCYADIYHGLDDPARRMLLRGLMFVRSGCHVNTSRIDPAHLFVDGKSDSPGGPLVGVMRLNDTREIAIGIMLGMSTECALVEHVLIGGNMSPIMICKITIAPFKQEMRRDTSAWGKLFDFDVIPGSVSDFGFGFSTRTKKVSSAGGTQSPVKSSVLSSVKSPVGKTVTSYEASLGFDTHIPIYDARSKPGFSFTDKDFARLTKLPLYSEGEKDLGPNAMVAVGYTLSTYRNSRLNGVTLSSNVQFVILLGIVP